MPMSANIYYVVEEDGVEKAEKTGPVELYNSFTAEAVSRSTGGSIVVPLGTGAPQDSQYRAEPIACERLTLRQILDRFGMTHIDLLKLDCEGSEFEILQDAPLDRIRCIVGEYHGFERWEQFRLQMFPTWDYRQLQRAGDMGNFHLQNPVFQANGVIQPANAHKPPVNGSAESLVHRDGFWVRADNIKQDLVIVRDIFHGDAYRTSTGLNDLMSAAGLTHGGFYKHFASKDQLVAEACAEAVKTILETLAAAASEKGGLRLPTSRPIIETIRPPDVRCPRSAANLPEAMRKPGRRRTCSRWRFWWRVCTRCRHRVAPGCTQGFAACWTRGAVGPVAGSNLPACSSRMCANHFSLFEEIGSTSPRWGAAVPPVLFDHLADGLPSMQPFLWPSKSTWSVITQVVLLCARRRLARAGGHLFRTMRTRSLIHFCQTTLADSLLRSRRAYPNCQWTVGMANEPTQGIFRRTQVEFFGALKKSPRQRDEATLLIYGVVVASRK